MWECFETVSHSVCYAFGRRQSAKRHKILLGPCNPSCSYWQGRRSHGNYLHPQPPLPPTTTHINLAVSQLHLVWSEHVRTFFDSTQSLQSKSEVCAQEFYTAMHIKTPFGNAFHFSSLWSNRSMWGHPNLMPLQMIFMQQCALRHIFLDTQLT